MDRNSATTVKKVDEASGDQAWVGFICKGCGAPLALHRSDNGSKPGERSTARLAHHLPKLRRARLLRARHRDGANYRLATLAVDLLHIPARKLHRARS